VCEPSENCHSFNTSLTVNCKIYSNEERKRVQKKKKKKKKGTHFKEAYFSEATYANLLAPIHTIFTKDIEKMEKEKET
jgi:hypothetical protein